MEVTNKIDTIFIEKVVNSLVNDDDFQELLYRVMDLNIYKIICQLQEEYPIVLFPSDMEN